MLRSDRAIDAVVAMAILVDVVLVLRTGISPEWWFLWLHGTGDPSPGEVALLYRCAAHWTAFILFQAVTLLRWRRWLGWLLVLAGVRLSDVFTDWTYLATSEIVTAAGTAGLLAPGLLNGAMGLFLIWAWRRRAG